MVDTLTPAQRSERMGRVKAKHTVPEKKLPQSYAGCASGIANMRENCLATLILCSLILGARSLFTDVSGTGTAPCVASWRECQNLALSSGSRNSRQMSKETFETNARFEGWGGES